MIRTVPQPTSLHAFAVAAVVAVGTAGCHTVEPIEAPRPASTAPQAFSHADFDAVLRRFVDDRGRVDYAALEESSAGLERYFASVARYSPDSHPGMFPTEESRLAYWINAYNAAAMLAVVRRYPISSVTDVGPPTLLFFLPDLAGFFVFQRMEFGGESMSLRHLENDVIRKRFAEPRIHFALNCASLSCPRLPNRAFTPEALHAELEREARAFVAEERGVRIDQDEGTVYLSQIFQWYEEDFAGWMKERHPEEEASLLGYVRLYLAEEEARLLEREGSRYEVRFMPYDWGLNDRKRAGVVVR